MKLLMTVFFAVHHIWCSIAAGIPVTTVCIEIKSVDPYVEPYFMCKGTEFPQINELAYDQDSYGNKEQHNTDAGIFNSPMNHAYKPSLKPPAHKSNYHETSTSSSNYDDKSNYNHHQVKPSYQSPHQETNYNKDKANNGNKLYSPQQHGKEYLNSHPDVYSNAKYSDVDLLPSFNKLDYNTPSKHGSTAQAHKDSSSVYGGATTHSALKLTVPNSEDNGPSSKYDGYRNFNTHQDAASPYASKFPIYTNDHGYLRSESPPSITNFYSPSLYEDHLQNKPLQSVSHQNSFIIPPYDNNDDYNTPVQSNYGPNVPTKIGNYYKSDIKLNQNPGNKGSNEYYSAPKSSYALPSTTKYPLPLDHLSPMTDKYYGKTLPKTIPSKQLTDHGDYQSKSISTPQHSTQDGSPRSISKYRQELSTGNGHKITSHIETHYNNQPYDFRSIEPSYMQVPIINHEFRPDIRSNIAQFSNSPDIRSNIPQFSNGPDIRYNIPQFSNGPHISSHIPQFSNGPDIRSNIPQFSSGPEIRSNIPQFSNGPQKFDFPTESDPIVGSQHNIHSSDPSAPNSQQYYPSYFSSAAGVPVAPSYQSSNQQCPNHYVYSMQPTIIPVPCFNPSPVYNLQPVAYHNSVGNPSISTPYTPNPFISKSLVTEAPNNDESSNKDEPNGNKNPNQSDGSDQQRHFVTPSNESTNGDTRTVTELLSSSTTEKTSFTTADSKSTSEMDYSMKKVPKTTISLGKKADNFNTGKRNENKAQQ